MCQQYHHILSLYIYQQYFSFPEIQAKTLSNLGRNQVIAWSKKRNYNCKHVFLATAPRLLCLVLSLRINRQNHQKFQICKMHLLIPLTLTLLAGSTLALSTTNDTMTLEKRGHHGWIRSFNENSCTNQPIGDRPELHWFDCNNFTPAAYGDNKIIGVNYGSFNYKVSALKFFSGTYFVLPIKAIV